MLGISGTELIIILLFGFMIFGPDKLPQMGRTVGRAIRQFRDASEAANKKFKEEVADPFQDAIAPYKDQIENSTGTIQEDLAAINDTFNDAKNMISNPIKDMFTPDASSTAAANNKPAIKNMKVETAVVTKTPQQIADDPFAEVFKDEETVSIEETIAKTDDAAKKSLASSLYDLDDSPEGGE